MSSCASTGRSPGFLLPKLASAAPYFRKLPAIQWYSPDPVRFSTASPQLRRCSLAPPSPEEPTRTRAKRVSNAFDADVFGVHRRIGFQIVQSPAGAPGPGSQSAPVIGLAGLALVDQADDA